MKTKKYLTIVLIILIVLASGIIGFVLGNKKQSDEEPSKNNNNVVDTDKNNLDNEIQLTTQEQKIFDALNEYGKEIYKNKTYTTFQKDSRGIYYASIKDLTELDYDVSFFDEKCNEESPVIYFDIDKKLIENYEVEPLQYVIKCNTQ